MLTYILSIFGISLVNYWLTLRILPVLRYHLVWHMHHKYGGITGKIPDMKDIDVLKLLLFFPASGPKELSHYGIGSFGSHSILNCGFYKTLHAEMDAEDWAVMFFFSGIGLIFGIVVCIIALFVRFGQLLFQHIYVEVAPQIDFLAALLLTPKASDISSEMIRKKVEAKRKSPLTLLDLSKEPPTGDWRTAPLEPTPPAVSAVEHIN